MNTKIITGTNRFINFFTKKGRTKNQIYNDLHEMGMREIRERNIAKDRFVLLASKVPGKGKSDITIGVDLKMGYIQKETNLSKFMTCFDKKISGITKCFSDWNGNLLRKVSQYKTFINGRTSASKIVTEVPEKYTKTSETGGPVVKRLSIDYANGNKYAFSEYESGHRVYNKIIDGVEYSFASKN